MISLVLKRFLFVSVEKKHFRKKKWHPKMSTVVHLKEVVTLYLSTKVSLEWRPYTFGQYLWYTNCPVNLSFFWSTKKILVNQKNIWYTKKKLVYQKKFG